MLTKKSTTSSATTMASWRVFTGFFGFALFLMMVPTTLPASFDTPLTPSHAPSFKETLQSNTPVPTFATPVPSLTKAPTPVPTFVTPVPSLTKAPSFKETLQSNTPVPTFVTPVPSLTKAPTPVPTPVPTPLPPFDGTPTTSCSWDLHVETASSETFDFVVAIPPQESITSFALERNCRSG